MCQVRDDLFERYARCFSTGELQMKAGDDFELHYRQHRNVHYLRTPSGLNRRLSCLYVGDGGLFDVVVIKRFAKRPGFRDFAIALLQVLVLGVVAKPGFPRLSLNDIGSRTAKFLILLYNMWDFVRVSPLKKHRQGDAIFNRLISPLAEMREHRVGGVA